MTASHPALLPSGFSDRLPAAAAQNINTEHNLLQHFTRHGYDYVKPPLLEFEESLLSGTGLSMARRTFRLMDPATQRMLALRADMTIQIARIAATRLIDAPRPLRLSYAGDVVHAQARDPKPDRQFTQIGIELIGSLAPAADAEVIYIAASSLLELGIHKISIDLSLPTLLTAVLAETDLSQTEKTGLRAALDKKDKATAQSISKGRADLALQLLDMSGPADQALKVFATMPLPPSAEQDRQRLLKSCEALQKARFTTPLTIDFVEWRGFEYQTGLSFTLFSTERALELGRGGRYRAFGPKQADSQVSCEGEPATGLTFYADALAEVLPTASRQKKLFLPFGTNQAEAKTWQQQGWVTVAGLDQTSTPQQSGCTHALINQQPEAI